MQHSVDHFVKLWQLKPHSQHIVQTTTGQILFADYGNHSVVLKVFNDESDEKKTADILTYFNGHGSVKVFEATDNAVLIEQAVFGTSLNDYLTDENDAEVTNIICKTITQLHKKELPYDKPAPSIEDIGRGFDRYLLSNNTAINHQLITAAHDIYRQLNSTQNTPILLHGDLHHGNILDDQDRGWLAIDPKGYLGESCYEVGAMLRNPIDRPKFSTNRTILKQRIDIICDTLNFPKERVMGWAFSQAVLAAIWAAEDEQNVEPWVNSASTLNSLM